MALNTMAPIDTSKSEISGFSGLIFTVKLANNTDTCYSKADHKIVSLLPAEIVGSQDADDDQQVAHHGQEDDRDEYEGLQHIIIMSSIHLLSHHFTLKLIEKTRL